MEKFETNRAKQLSIEQEYQKGINLLDIDTTIADYMKSKIIPDLKEKNEVVKVPLIYGNAERWNTARKNGYLLDSRGKIQIPLIMFNRTGVDTNDNLIQLKDMNTISTYRKYSEKNKYDRFSLMQKQAVPVYEEYKISVPSYVTVNYEVIAWTSFTEHMNIIVEAYQYASNRYWGNESGYKFKTTIGSFDTSQELSESSERILRTNFSLSVNAYLLPETFDEKPTVSKSFTTKRLVITSETVTNIN